MKLRKIAETYQGSTVDHLVFGGGAFAASDAGARHRVEALFVAAQPALDFKFFS